MKDEFDWQEFLNFAKMIFDDYKKLSKVTMVEESTCRIGISRAYYATFHNAEKFLREIEKNFQPQLGEGPHDRIINAFKRTDNPYHKKIYSKLGMMKDLRERADYSPQRYSERYSAGNAIGELQKAISFADSVNTIIDKCRQAMS